MQNPQTPQRHTENCYILFHLRLVYTSNYDDKTFLSTKEISNKMASNGKMYFKENVQQITRDFYIFPFLLFHWNLEAEAKIGLLDVQFVAPNLQKIHAVLDFSKQLDKWIMTCIK